QRQNRLTNKGRTSLNERMRTPAKRASGEKHIPQSKKFEALVLGSGTGGKLIAWYMAQSGRQTAVVERRWVGGSCPNIACMPSKNEISNAPDDLFHNQRLEALGRRGKRPRAGTTGKLWGGGRIARLLWICERRPAAAMVLQKTKRSYAQI